MKILTQSKQYGPPQYSLNDSTLDLPYKIKKQLKIYKNIVNFEEDDLSQFHHQKSSQVCKQKRQLPIPYKMSQTFTKYMHLYRITAYLSLVSILISLVDIYKNQQMNQIMLIIINNCVTLAIWIAMFLKIKQFWRHQFQKKVSQEQFWDIWQIVDFLITIPHPTVWTAQINYFLHLTIIFRLILLIKYIIYSSPYCDVRAYRIITTYGLNSSQHFFFAVKSLVASLDLFSVLFIQLLSLLYFSHALYVVSKAGQIEMQFMDCFEVIIVSVPTVGFGEYDMPFIGQKILIFAVVILGAVFNSFITLTMLNQLQMNNQQLSSYWLMQKVKTRQSIENLSKKFITQQISLLKNKKNISQERQAIQNQQIHYAFRNEYRLKKSLYHSISYTDINNLFTYFRQSLIQFRTKSRQVDNMLYVLLRCLGRKKFPNKMRQKNRKKEQDIKKISNLQIAVKNAKQLTKFHNNLK